MNNIDPIQEELAQAGEASPITPSLLQLDSCRIMTDTEVPEEEFLFRMYGKPCFPRRDISTVTGMEKCGKTIFTSMLMACCAEKDVLELERIREKPDYQTRNTDDRFLSNKSEAYQINQEKARTFNQKYIIQHEGNTRQPWEWNLRLLFNEAMGPVAEMAPEGLKERVMKIAGIQQPKYYDKVFTLATEKRIVKSTIAKNGRVVVIPIPS